MSSGLPITSSLHATTSISREEAENLTMTEFQLMLIAKYPDQKGYTVEEYDDAADAYFARRKRKQAKANQ